MHPSFRYADRIVFKTHFRRFSTLSIHELPNNDKDDIDIMMMMMTQCYDDVTNVGYYSLTKLYRIQNNKHDALSIALLRTHFNSILFEIHYIAHKSQLILIEVRNL